MRENEFDKFTSNVNLTELHKKLIINIEKDFSDSKIDIKIF